MENFIGYSLTQIIAALGGYGMLIAALSYFLSKLWLARIVEREKNVLQKQLDDTNRRLQSELDKNLHVSKSQFDLELTNYKDIWSKLIDLKTATLSIRPVFDNHDPQESNETRRERRLSKFDCCFKAVYNQIEKSKPFYAQEVYDNANLVIKTCHDEAIDSDYKERLSREYWDEAMKNRDSIITAIENTCKAIRSRLWEIRVDN